MRTTSVHPAFVRRPPRAPVARNLRLSDVEHMSGRRTFSRAKKQRGRTKTPGQIFMRLQQDAPAPRHAFVHEFVRWFCALHLADPRAVYHYMFASPRGRWFVAIDQQPDGTLDAAVCANPLAWNAARNQGDAPLRILRGVHGPYDRQTAGRMCAQIKQQTLNT